MKFPFQKRKNKTYFSDISGILRICDYAGEKTLNSLYANYSFGPLQRVLEFGLEKIDFGSIENILVLGMGGGSVIDSLRKKFDFKGKITAVDLDPVVIQIAEEEFGIKENKNQKILNQDAVEFVQNCRETFDLVIIDIFIDIIVPEVFYQKKFLFPLSKLIRADGFFIFNLGIDLNKDSKEVSGVYSFFEKEFDLELYEKLNEVNLLLIGKRKPEV